MRIRKIANELNVVTEIDELIMELTYIRNGNLTSIDKLKKGVEIIELIISCSEKPEEKDEKEEEILGLNPFHYRQHFYSGKYQEADHKHELEKAKESIKKFMENPTGSDKKDIEEIQELLLKISIPIWKEKISILKPKQYKA